MTWTTIGVKEATLERLKKLKSQLGVRNWDDLLNTLLQVYEFYVVKEKYETIRKVLCNDLRESRASLSGWFKLLYSRGFTADMLAEAMNYLRPDGQDYIVDNEKCVSD